MRAYLGAACCLGVLAFQPLLGNGGGYFRGGVENSGDLAGFEPSETGNVRILDEKLTIKLGPKEATVEVRYLMKNVTDKKAAVRFGFPVEESVSSDLMGGQQPVPDSKKLSYCKNYQIAAGGKPLKATWQGEAKPQQGNRFKGIAGWMVSERTFAPNEEVPVTIQFQSEYPREEWSVSDNDSISASIFRYRLSTASCWAGTLGEGRISIEANGIDPSDIRVVKPVNRFKKEGDRWVWHFENLEPTMADDLEIEAVPTIHTYPHHIRDKQDDEEGAPPHKYATYIDRGGKWSMAHSNYEVKASSTLKPDGEITYVPENIRDWDGNSAWTEGVPGSGKDEWLEITPAVAKPLREILLEGGYQKRDVRGNITDLFTKNARPKKVLVELNGEKRFEADIPDRPEETAIPVKDYNKPVKKIRLTFTEVYEGSTFQDLCISRLRLNVPLDKKPSLGPVR